MNRLTLAIGIALLCAIPAHAQDSAVIVRDPDPPTPAIQQTTTTTMTEHSETVTPVHASGAKAVHRTVRRHPVQHPSVAYHRPAIHESTDTQTTTQTTIAIPPHDPETVVSEHADGSVTVSPAQPVQPADQDDGQH